VTSRVKLLKPLFQCLHSNHGLPPLTMASTSRAHPSIQRINNAYVQVPASPLSLASYHPLGTPVRSASSTKLKENTPFRLFTTNLNPSTSRKRKLSDCIHDGPISVVKRSKLNAADETPSKVKAPRSQQIVPTANACPDFPNGYVYCHQCSRKRDILSKFASYTSIIFVFNILIATIQCNTVIQRQTKHKGTVERPCTNKYCKACLKRRYNEDQGCANGVVSFFK
jgi:ribosomal protein L34E